MERRPWIPHEDQVLKNLYEKVKLNKWSLIARRMQEEFSLPPRTGKQCRQRYNNHLNPCFAKEGWGEQQERDLLRLHDQLGNKWAVIAARLGGRTDNGVKNHFFAKLRKSMRRINKIIQERFRRQLRDIKLNVLYKIVEASEQRFKKTPLCTEQTSKFSCALKNQILNFSQDTLHTFTDPDFVQLVNRIHVFGKTYKRKPKQLRRVPDQNREFSDGGTSPPQAQPSQGIFEHEDSEDEIIRPDERFEPLFQRLQTQEAEAKRNLRSKSLRSMASEVDEKPQTEAQRVLNGLMVEEDENSLMPLPPMLIKRYTSSQFLVDSSRNDHQFFQDSGIHNNLPPPMAFSALMKKESYDEPLFRPPH